MDWQTGFGKRSLYDLRVDQMMLWCCLRYWVVSLQGRSLGHGYCERCHIAIDWLRSHGRIRWRFGCHCECFVRKDRIGALAQGLVSDDFDEVEFLLLHPDP